MNFGIPFRKPFGAPFGVPFLGGVTGGLSPSLPTAGNVGYYSAYDINTLGFSSTNAVNWWQDQGIAGSSNDLTQGTASANMTFIEHDTVTQFTLANQPTLVDLGGGELVANFPPSKSLKREQGIVSQTSTKHTIEIEFTRTASTQYMLSSTLLGGYSVRIDASGTIRMRDDSSSVFTLAGYTFTVGNKYKITITLDTDTGDVEAWVDGVFFKTGTIVNTFNSTTDFNTLGNTLDLHLYSYRYWDVVVADPSNITETPDFELIPSEESCNVLAGQQVSRWNSTTHKPWLNRLLSDGNDDHLEGVAVQTGDFTYMFKLSFNALSTTEYIYSHTTGLSAVVLLSDNYIYLRDTTGANDIGLTGHTVEAGEHVYTITREGDSLKYYVDSCLKNTVDVTGRNFELDTFGSPADSLADLTAEWGVWNRALTKEELDYFSYLRSEDTNEILLPPLTPNCPTIYPLSAFNAKNNNETAYTTGSSLPSLASLKSSGFSISCFVNIPTGQDGIRLFNMRADPSDTSLVSDISVNVYSGVTKISFYNGSTSTTLDNIGPVVGEGLTHVGFTYEGGTDTVTPYINGVQSQGTQVIATWNATSNSNVLVWCGANVEGYTAENPNGTFAMPRLQNRKITATEMLYLAQNPSVCYDDMDNTSGLKDATIYAPTLGEYNGSTNQALVDPASGTTTVVSEPVDYDGTGLSVECNT